MEDICTKNEGYTKSLTWFDPKQCIPAAKVVKIAIQIVKSYDLLSKYTLRFKWLLESESIRSGSRIVKIV